ncbi:HelD family protein [Shouchella miscanthi]|uniref:3'-5' exonuclease n=1 Tax=Shouchella miscanthi TaxID=2598861 RepID=A0ABU6NSP3_9BACI|nr:3'-5' exonuclease [Shouchella miscanthi]MED4130275.1 3'-5' exonuclease [Shouchella miscanthi]
MNQHDYETAVLKASLKKIDRMFTHVQQIPIYRGDDFTQQVLEDRREAKRQSLRIANEEPYFARLDFLDFENEDKKALYIGKVGVHDDEEDHPLVIDWRAPVASLFYSFNGSEEDVYYESPDGIVEGEIQLKRNVVIRGRELKRVVDSYVEGQESSGGDEFLLYKLGEQKDNKLKDIVSTIQAEQNSIIRSDVKKPLLIQGAAGSGKTTVALHRLAFLLYEYRERLKAERMMIFAPNAMFLDYIAQVLPELGVGDIQQSTYVDWALQKLDDSYEVESTEDRIFTRFELQVEPENQVVIKEKGSLAFRDQLKKYVEEEVANRLPIKDFIPWASGLVQKETIQEWITQDFAHSAPLKQRERLQARLKRWVEIEVRMFEDEKERKAYKTEGLKAVRSYMNSWKKPDELKLYLNFLQQQNHPISQSLRSGKLFIEDLAPMVYIHQQLIGIDKEARFDHLVIDEAQDLSPFIISLLNDYTRKGGLTILGDLAQGIHGEEGIVTWDSFIKVLGQNCTYVQMEKSYRSTMEIIEYSNGILEQVENHPPLAKPVFRSGEPVKVISYSLSSMLQWLSDVKAYETIAFLTRTKKEAETLALELKEAAISATLIRAGDTTYKGGISILPIYLSKGFEFDAVMLTNVSNHHYPNNPVHQKLLYVGCTRALHSLSLSYEGTLSPIIPL